MSEARVPPNALEEERAVLGAVMVNRYVLRELAVQVGLHPRHFYRERHATIWRACLRLLSRRHEVDAVTVWRELETMGQAGGMDRHEVQSLPDDVPAPSNAPTYARAILEAAQLRAKLTGAQRVIEGVHERDESAIEKGIAELTRDVIEDPQPSTPEELTQAFISHLSSRESIETFALPWEELNGYAPGGFMRGHLVALVAFSSMGKSIMLDQMLTHFAGQGYRPWLFTTEMGWKERVARYVSRKSGIKYADLILNRMRDDRQREVAIKMTRENPIPFGIRDASGWTAERIGREIIGREIDVAAIDPINLLPHRDQWEVAETARYLQQTARNANACIINVCHLNNARLKDENFPPPVMRDIRDSGMIAANSDHVLALHRENSKGRVHDSGKLYFLKVRGGVRGGIKVVHRPGQFIFEVENESPPPETQQLVPAHDE
jgi:replicative DNA helicase